MNEGAALATGTAIGIGVILLILAVSGLIIGALARLLLPGPDAMSIGRTMLYGLGGSLLGGLISRLAGINSAVLNTIIGVLVAMGLIWFFTRRRKS